MQIIQLGLRGLQLVFSAVVLALTVVLINGQKEDSVPAVTNFEAFNGGWGIIIAVVGVVGAFVEAVPRFVLLGLDGFTTIFFLAGSTAYANKLGVNSCVPDPDALEQFGYDDVPETASFYTIRNEIINAGAFSSSVDYAHRCRLAQADTAFLFFALACFAGSLIMSFFGGSGGGGGGGGMSKGMKFKMPGRKSGTGNAQYV
ncbi:MAG: hypothetical protein M1831_002761 [Alyxoria varia]|nr:MAG: hypothetical protein M1831_002761 [Alyxoria varia]